MEDRTEAFDRQLIAVTHAFLQESAAANLVPYLSIHAKLEHELGIGSLEKVELFGRIEQAFDTLLPKSLLSTENTLKEIRDHLIVLSTEKVKDIAQHISIPAINVDSEKIITHPEVLSSCAEAGADQLSIEQGIAAPIVKKEASQKIKSLKKRILTIVKLAYTIYLGTLLLITLIPLWLIGHVLSRRQVETFVKAWARLILWLSGCPLLVKGKKNIAKNQPYIFVANHSSYVDVLLLLTVLPKNTCYIGKKELLSVPIIGFFLKKMHHICVDRWNTSKSETDMAMISEVLKENKSVLFFPEGTFTSFSGLRPFKLGAYKLSVDSGVPLVPIAIRNARFILPSGRFLVSRAPIEITILKSECAKGKAWRDMIKLRDRSRKKISEHCGEKPIDFFVAGPESGRHKWKKTQE